MTTLTLTRIPELGAIAVRVGSIGWNLPTVVTRSDGNGVAPVRLLPGQTPSSGFLYVTDYECAISGAVTYSVEGVPNGDVTNTTTWPGAGVAAVFVSQIGKPGNGAAAVAVTDYRGAADAAGLAWVPGRVDPIPLGVAMRAATESWTLTADDYGAASAVAHVVRTSAAVAIRQPAHRGLDVTGYPSRCAIRPAPEQGSPRRWLVDVDVVRVPSIPGDLLGAAGWTLDDVTAGWATFDALAATFATFNALTAGP